MKSKINLNKNWFRNSFRNKKRLQTSIRLQPQIFNLVYIYKKKFYNKLSIFSIRISWDLQILKTLNKFYQVNKYYLYKFLDNQNNVNFDDNFCSQIISSCDLEQQGVVKFIYKRFILRTLKKSCKKNELYLY